jgi:Leucine-rich repeat (LRR) protein
MRVFQLIIVLIIISCTSSTKYRQTVLDVSNKGLNQLPDSILKMQYLEHLNLGNAFTLYPPLSVLGSDKRVIGKDDNQLVDLPQNIIQLKRLRSLYIQANQLRRLPSEFHQLTQLDTLDISFNEYLQLSKIMGELEKMTGLRYLNIVGISVDAGSIEKLKKALPNTKVITTFHDLEFDTTELE